MSSFHWQNRRNPVRPSAVYSRPITACPFFRIGKCRFGHRCWYLHDRNIREDPDVVAVTRGMERFLRSPDKADEDVPAETVSNIGSMSQEPNQVLPETTQPHEIKDNDDSENIITHPSGSIEIKNGENKKKVEIVESIKESLSEQINNKIEEKMIEWNKMIQSVIDSYLLCNICFEIFIKPIVLNCTHTFCESCIQVWTKKSLSCPICRKGISSKTHCLSLENFLEKIVEFIPQDVRLRRETSIKERDNSKKEAAQENINDENNGEGNRHLNIQYRNSSGGLTLEMLDTPDASELDSDSDSVSDMIVDDFYQITQQSAFVNMNLRDTILNSGGVNPLLSYLTPEQLALQNILERYGDAFVRE